MNKILYNTVLFVLLFTNFLINANASDLKCSEVAPHWPVERMQVVRTLGPNAIN